MQHSDPIIVQKEFQMLGGLNWYEALDAEVTQKQERTSVVRGGEGV